MNYISGIVRILETSKYNLLSTNIIKAQAQLPQLRKTQVVTLIFWNHLAHAIDVYNKTKRLYNY